MKERVIGVVRERLPLVAQQPDTSDERYTCILYDCLCVHIFIFIIASRTNVLVPLC